MIKSNLYNILRLLGLITFSHLGQLYALAQSNAHIYSEYTIIDPTYSTEMNVPMKYTDNSKTPWIYGPSELECWRLQLLQTRKDSAKLNVGYPGVFHKPYLKGSFRLKLKNAPVLNSIVFRAVGYGKVYINDSLIGQFPNSEFFHSINFEKKIAITKIQFDIETYDDPIALLVECKDLATLKNTWEWKPKEGDWGFAYQFPQNNKNLPPHRLEEPLIALKPKIVKNNIYDFGRELYGFIEIKSQSRPIINIGESLREVNDIDNVLKEQSLEMDQKNDSIWRTKNSLAFRYLYVENSEIENITCDAMFYPATYKGAFACSDSTLNRIWMHSAYTLRLNMHDFLLDGIKRDRLPWAGDLVMSLLVNAFTFYDPEIVRRSLIALGRAGIEEENINGIIDYSLWWIIAQDQYQLYFKDENHLEQEWERIKETLQHLSVRSDSMGFLRMEEDTWLFIDWVEQEKWSALQILWWWAQKSGSRLAKRLGDRETSDYLEKNAEKLKIHLTKTSWDIEDEVWLPKYDAKGKLTRHPNFLAILSGLTRIDHATGIKELLEKDSIESVGTPYMAGFEVMALAELGNTEYMLDYVNDYWGGMLNKGASTFWEAYNPDESYEEQYSFYGRPYGKSLCHAWSAGPAAFLPLELLQLKPLRDGWEHFTINPNLGSLEWLSVCLPTRYGSIKVDIENNDIQIFIPKGTILRWNDKLVEGPFLLKEKL